MPSSSSFLRSGLCGAGYLLSYSVEGADDITEDPISSRRNAFMGKFDVQAGESVDLYSKLGEGTKFVVTLPRTRPKESGIPDSPIARETTIDA